MSEWRDARLQRALREAPDGDQSPSAGVREAVRLAAHRAVAPTPWWKSLWVGREVAPRLPWAAAFGTLMVASLVTLLWHDREIPGARVEGPARDVAAPAAPPRSPTAASPASAILAPPAPQPAKVESAPRNAAPPQPPAQPRVQLKAAPTPSSPAPDRHARERSEPSADLARAAPPEPRDEERSALAKSGEASKAPSRAPAQEQVSSDRPGTAAPTMQAGVTPSAPAAASALAARADAAPWTDWSHAILSAQGRSVELPRDEATRLAELVRVLSRDARSQEPADEPVTARVELRRQAQATMSMELAGSQLRWTQHRPRGETFTTRPDPIRLQALRDEIARLLQR